MSSLGTHPTVPRSNPFDVSDAYAAVMRLSLGLALVPGLSIGLLLVLVAGLRLPWAIPWAELAQVHGQVQTLGFTLLFVIAVALQLFPRFFGVPLVHAERAVQGGILVALALLVRLAIQPFDASLARGLALTCATAAVPVGAVLAGWPFHSLSRRSVQPNQGPSAAWRRFVVVGGLALGAALVLYVWSGLQLAAGAAVVPVGLDEALIHLELVGFPTSLILGVASRVFGRFLLLRTRPALETRLPLLATLWGTGLALVTCGWLLDPSVGVWLRLLGILVELAVLLSWLWLTRLYQAPSRPSGTPYVTNPTRRWVQCAFAFLLLALTLDAGIYAREALLGGGIPLFTALSAGRHALAQGFLLPLMVSMAVRLLPVISADALKHRRRMEVIVDALLVGALVRVAAEAVNGYGLVTGPLVALGGALGVAAFILFAVTMWSSLRRLPHSLPLVQS